MLPGDTYADQYLREIVVMLLFDKYVVFRYKGCSPQVKTVKEFKELYNRFKRKDDE